MNLRDRIFFALGIICILLAIGLNAGFVKLPSPVGYKNFSRTIKERIDEGAERIKLQHSKVAAHLLEGGNVNFGEWGQMISQPLFVYKNGKLIYWSDNKFIPDYKQIKSWTKTGVLKSVTGKVILFKDKLILKGDVFELCSYIHLTFKYPFKNQYLKPGLNAAIFPPNILAIKELESDYNIKSLEGDFLFSFDIKENTQAGFSNKFSFSLLLVLGLVFLFIGTYGLLSSNSLHRNFDISFLVLILILVIIRSIFPFFNYWGHSTEEVVPFYVQWLQPNATELIWNALFLYIPGIYFLLNISNSKIIKGVFDISYKFPVTTAYILLIINALVAYAVYKYFYILFLDTHPAISIVIDPHTVADSLMLLFSILLASGIYFIASHLLARLFHANNGHLSISTFILSTLLFLITIAVMGCFIEMSFFIVALLSFGYLLIISKSGLSATLGRVRYVTYIYFFMCAIFCAFLGAFATYESEINKSEKQLKDFADKINKEEGYFNFPRLKVISDSLRTDIFIRNSFTNPLYEKGAVEQKISKIYLGSDFDKYESNIYIFNKQGICINKSIKGSYFSYYQNYNKSKFKTVYGNIFQIRDIVPVYYSFIEIRSPQNTKTGFVVLEFKLQRGNPNSVFPELLLERSAPLSNTGSYNYAIFQNNKILASYGDFNYFKVFRDLDQTEKETLKQSMIKGGKLHKLFSYQAEKDIVVSIPAYSYKQVYSNFSFLFLFQVFVIAIFIFGNTFYYKLRQVSSTFTTKIQLFINFAFFLPLVVMSVATFSIINWSFQEELQSNFIKKAEDVSLNLVHPLASFLKQRVSTTALSDELNRIAKYIQADVNLYTVEGKLIVTTQPRIFEVALLSGYINPVAYENIVENQETSNLLQESIGLLKYNTVYYRIKSFETEELLGILAVPYFGSDKELQSKVVEVLTSILTIFTTIFILFLIVSYFASGFLTIPLTMLTNKIKQTSLNKMNEPLIYKATDEIGLLVREYNKMLINLEESKTALAITEKEAAWREMARQVAHEIKNPLTPMKLTLQNLQRLLSRKDENFPELVSRSVVALLEQVENLSDIATSFSAFTQMPMLKREKFEISTLLKNVIYLFQNQQDAQIEANIAAGNFYVMGDAKLMMRIFINLLTNAFEAFSTGDVPVIIINLVDNGSCIIIEIKDKGKGIPLEYQEKIFQPNFSTKTGSFGIGLAVAKRGVEQMAGKIWYETKQGIGTSFFIEMDLVKEEDEDIN